MSRRAPVGFVTLKEISVATGMSWRTTLLVLRETGLHARYARFTGRKVVFKQQVIDLLHALRGEPHRPLVGPSADWLTEFTTSGGDTHARGPQPRTGKARAQGPRSGPGARGRT